MPQLAAAWPFANVWDLATPYLLECFQHIPPSPVLSEPSQLVLLE